MALLFAALAFPMVVIANMVGTRHLFNSGLGLGMLADIGCIVVVASAPGTILGSECTWSECLLSINDNVS